MKKVIVLVVSMAICFATAQSQSFLQYYYGTGNTLGNIKFSVIQPQGPGFIIAGSFYNSTTDNGIVVIKMSAQGVINYNKIIRFPDNQDTIVPTCMKYKKGVLYLGGFIYNSNPALDNGFLLKFNVTSSTLTWINIIQERSRVYDLNATSNGTLVICGEIYYSGSPDIEALLYSANPTTGAFTQILQSHEANNAADTYTSMDILDDTIFLTGRFELSNDNSKMRPVFVKTDLNGNIILSNYYLKDRNNSAKMYGYDIIIDDGDVFLLATGDIDNTINIREDDVVYSTDQSGLLQWSTQVDEFGIFDGLFTCIDIYNHDSSRDLIIWGSTWQSTELSISKLTSVDDAGFINWSNSYDGIFAHAPNTANSMLVVNDTIYAVGWFDDGDYILGAVLKVPASNGVLEACYNELDPTETSRDFEDAFTIDNSNNTYTSDDLEESMTSLSYEQYVECPLELRINHNTDLNKDNSEIKYLGENQILIQTNENYDIKVIEYILYNTTGQIILRNFLNENHIVNLNTLPAGIYFIGLNTNNVTFYSDKLIIH